ncbi:MAG: TIGR00282 family metallophosphoesterase [Nitrospinae bacterium]|nr:TIGR00282 family metallophosphoesterase [Nitrospinota bacterium]
MFNLLFVGDIVGKPGRKVLKHKLPEIIERHNVNYVVANCENSAGGKGVTTKTLDEVFNAGVDVVTGGNHFWDKKDQIPEITANPSVIRPANYGPAVLGKGFGIYTIEKFGLSIGVINLMGRVFIEIPLDCPFRKFDAIFDEIKNQCDIILVDFHGEATSEKIAFGRYVDGRATMVFGTHTHVQTADEQVFPKGTAYISDAGMTGPKDSVIGVKVDGILKRFLTGLPIKHEVAEGNNTINAVLVSCKRKTFKVESILRINE